MVSFVVVLSIQKKMTLKRIVRMSLQFSNVDEAFAPLQNQHSEKRRRLKERNHETETHETETHETHERTRSAPPGGGTMQLLPSPTIPQKQRTLADEIIAIQPYLSAIFMTLVVGMLYDMRQVALELRQALPAMQNFLALQSRPL
jgi:hypothetical protein|tara:strand:+ start:1022 stop:1456 length:435 start_codon:yes stop_codon:yes gene_type:complete